MIYERVMHQYRDRETGITVFLPTDKIIKTGDMRTIKELLVLLRRKLPWVMMGNEYEGMCGVLARLRRKGIITSDEAKIVYLYLYEHRPEGTELYFFPRGKILPRYMFLTRLIKELK